MSDGMGFGANARTALITRGLAEMSRLGLALGAQAETFTGMAGLGDLVLTCTDNQSRNRRFGMLLGQGTSVEEAQETISQVVEGYRNTKEVYLLAASVGSKCQSLSKSTKCFIVVNPLKMQPSPCWDENVKTKHVSKSAYFI